MFFRHGLLGDIGKVVEIYDRARLAMAAAGNPNQWINGYPSKALIEADIGDGKNYVCVATDRIVATFYFAIEIDPTYDTIYEGRWLNDDVYGVVHRLAVDAPQRGIATACLEWCLQRIGNIRIDTHQDNFPMRKVLQKSGFVPCGRIAWADGFDRIAFQKCVVR